MLEGETTEAEATTEAPSPRRISRKRKRRDKGSGLRERNPYEQ